MDEKKLKFPADFFWGAATSSHQVEGRTNNNWSEWERVNAERLAGKAGSYWQDWQREKFPQMFDPNNYISGKACDHYNLYEKDFDLAKEGGHNAHRFSLEWSRIEPEEGRFDEAAIEHYRKVILALRERGMEPFVTLWHWTNPLWLEAKGGCEKGNFPFYFARYAKFVAEKLKGEVKFWFTINEPTSVIGMAYLRGEWPPQKKNFFLAWKMYGVFAEAHRGAYTAIHEVAPEAQVGFANVLVSFEPYRKNNLLDRLMVVAGRYISNRRMLVLTEGFNDFLTVQYYFHNRFKFPRHVHDQNNPVSDLGWEIFPYGIYRVINKLKEHGLPIYVTETGLADADDSRREEFMKKHLNWVRKAMDDGADVRGYFYWSLLDNFEWDKGFWPRFGLIEVDYATMERKPRKSFYAYKEIIENSK